jgi:hypothetical protein
MIILINVLAFQIVCVHNHWVALIKCIVPPPPSPQLPPHLVPKPQQFVGNLGDLHRYSFIYVFIYLFIWVFST